MPKGFYPGACRYAMNDHVVGRVVMSRLFAQQVRSFSSPIVAARLPAAS
jgi:hypothetical protein